ncbi:MAG TPA: PIN domain-containing protein [Flavobacteriales bacterium]|nr:PIN domain-containing protein [Bacteroidota bacterium]MCO5275525.1 PIN domain-containing protein [Flavobacteriales bacterium]HRN36314.1 PIN domain-containing protein [Flavobacteriales bacterium]HRO39374.1 PIN domain-containing protein [Flavobacteriales bacterium]HRP80688.1 PIN domain-containing protein [Flavobacteriales bacterium]
MSGGSLVLDTSVAIDILGGDERAAALVQGAIVYVSVITRVELLSVAKPRTHSPEAAKAFLADCKLVQFSDEVQDLTIRLRKTYKLKLPDAAIAATAAWLNARLITADEAFTKIGKDVSVLIYER